MDILHAMGGLVSIIIMVSLGYYITKMEWLNQENSALLPRLVIGISVPAYMIWNLMSTFNKEKLGPLLFGIVVPFTSIIISFLIGYVISNFIKIGPNRKGTFRSTFSASSAIFVGVPVNLALFGEASLPYVLIYSFASAFLFWTIGNYSISLDGKKSIPKMISIETLKNIFTPPLIAFFFAVILIFLGIDLPKFASDTCRYLGGMTTPLSMLFIGFAIYGVKITNIKFSQDIIVLLIGRFIISGLVVLIVAHFIPIPEIMRKVFTIEAILPASTNTTILARNYEADTEYAALLVTITTVLAILVIPIYMVFV